MSRQASFSLLMAEMETTTAATDVLPLVVEGASVAHTAGASVLPSFSVTEYSHTASLEAFLATLPSLQMQTAAASTTSTATATAASKNHVSCVESQDTNASLMTHANCGRFNSGMVAATGDHVAADAFFATFPSINNINDNNNNATPSAGGWMTGPADVAALPALASASAPAHAAVVDFATMAATANAGDFFASFLCSAGAGASASTAAATTTASVLPRSFSSLSLSELFNGDTIINNNNNQSVVPDASTFASLSAMADLSSIIVVDVQHNTNIDNNNGESFVGAEEVEMLVQDEEEDDDDEYNNNDDEEDEDDEYVAAVPTKMTSSATKTKSSSNNTNNNSKKRKRAPKVAASDEVKQTAKYQERRRKNNLAAARNREMKRQQAKQEHDRLPALTTRNLELKEQCAVLKDQLALLKTRLAARMAVFGLAQ